MPTRTKTAQLPVNHIRADVVPESWNPDERTIDLVWTTGAKGLRWGWDGRYYEELAVTPEAVRMDRMNNGAPVLNSHWGYNLTGVMGVVARAWLQDGKGHATVKFSDREDVEPYVRDVVAGIIRNVSVGYAVHTYEVIEHADEKIPTYRAVDWEPMEISLVPIGFDDGAKVRSQQGDQQQRMYEVRIISSAGSGERQEETTVKRNGQNGTAATKPAQQRNDGGNDDTVTDANDANDRGGNETDEGERSADPVTAERRRATGILEAVRAAKLGEEFAHDLIARGVSLDQARKAIIDEWASQDPAAGTSGARAAGTPGARISVTRDEVDTRRRAMQDALLLRANPRAEGVNAEAARQYRGMTLLEMARESVEARGISTRGMDRLELAGEALGIGQRSAHGTSDFPIILANVANQTLRRAYDLAPQTFRPLVREVTATDFKEMTRAQLGDAPQLLEVPEHGEYQRGTIGEAKESYRVKTFGRIVAITRQAIVNDDMDAFSRLPQMYGRSAANLESDIVWGLITSNPTMGDGVAVFHAAKHRNLATGQAIGDISIPSLGEARRAMRVQKSLDGDELNLVAEYLLVPAALQTVAEQYLASIAALQSDKVNPFAGQLQPIVESRLDAVSTKGWYTAASPNQIDMIEVAYLDGNRGPRLESRVGFDVDGLELKCSYDFGAAIIDYRGFYSNPGA